MDTVPLYAQVWEHPEDDHARLVLADALALVGDPRAELIQLQIMRARERDPRVMRLLQQHGLTWLGALRGHVVPTAYERGFVSGCLAVDGDACAGADEWATVRTIELSREGGGVGFLAHGVMRSLRAVVAVTPRQWHHLPALPRVEVIEQTSRWLERPDGRFPALRRIATARGLVALERDADGRFSRLDASYCDTLAEILTRLDGLTEVVVRDVPVAMRDTLTQFARSQPSLVRFELNGVAQPRT